MNGLTPTRPSLLLQLRDTGDQRAWEDFVRIYTPLIYGFCRQRHHDLSDADAADITQEVIARSGIVREAEKTLQDDR